jgi:hypothetical protein
MDVVVKTSANFLIYLCENDWNEIYCHVIIEEGGYEKNSLTLAYFIAKMWDENGENVDVKSAKKLQDAISLFNYLTASNVKTKARRQKMKGGADGVQDVDNAETNTSDTAPETEPDTEDSTIFHFTDTIKRPKTVISTSYSITVQTQIKLLNELQSVFITTDEETGTRTVSVPPATLLPLPVIHPMCGGSICNGFTYDYRIIKQEYSPVESYNKKSFAQVYDDDVMVRCLLGLPGDLLVCKRVLFDESPYDEYVIKQIVSRIDDDPEE